MFTAEQLRRRAGHCETQSRLTKNDRHAVAFLKMAELYRQAAQDLEAIETRISEAVRELHATIARKD